MREINKTQVGYRIKYIRETFGLTQLQLAEKFDVSVGAVNNWELGRNLPRRAYLIKIAEMGQKTVEYLLYGVSGKFTNEQLADLETMQEVYLSEVEQDNPFAVTYTISIYLNHVTEVDTDKECAEVIREFINYTLEDE